MPPIGAGRDQTQFSIQSKGSSACDRSNRLAEMARARTAHRTEAVPRASSHRSPVSASSARDETNRPTPAAANQQRPTAFPRTPCLAFEAHGDSVERVAAASYMQRAQSMHRMHHPIKQSHHRPPFALHSLRAFAPRPKRSLTIYDSRLRFKRYASVDLDFDRFVEWNQSRSTSNA